MNVPDWFHGLSSALDTKMGMILDEVTPTRAVGRYPVEGNTQPFGLWHGGASCVVAETLASLASAAEVGPGGHFFGTQRTIATFETAFHRPIISTTQNYGAWLEAGGLDATQRAHRLYKQALAEYERPPIAEEIREALDAFVARRIGEGGAPLD